MVTLFTINNMSQVQVIIWIMIGLMAFVFIMILWFLWVKRDDIHSFFYPGQWAEIEMLESDNNCSTWLQRKNPDLRFEFNGGHYNMFEKGIEEPEPDTGNELDKVPIPKKKISTAIYRAGRLSKFFYIEGNEDPLDFRTQKISGNAALSEQREKIETIQLFTKDKSDMEKNMERIIPIVIVVGIIIIIIILYLQGQHPAAVAASRG